MPGTSQARSPDRRRRWTLALAYAALIVSCDSPFAPVVEEVTRLDITPPVLTMVLGGNATLVARVYGSDPDIPLSTARVFWSTQDPTVVTVNQGGVVSAVGAGTGQIAASSGGLSRTIAVTVSPRPIALVRITPPAANVIAGQTLALSGEAIDGEGTVLSNRVLEWSSSAPEIATVDATGLVTGVAIGQSTISAVGEGKVGTSIVTVVPAPVAAITVDPDGGSLPAGGTLALTATPRDANGQPLTGRTLQWRSSNDAVATVSAAGLLTAITAGTVTITVSAPGGGPDGSTPSASVVVTVLISPVASAVIVPSPIGIQVAQTAALTVNLFDESGEPLSPAGRTFTWTSTNASVASVSSTGVVTGVGVGTATVTASIATPGQLTTIQASTQVNVSNQPVASLVIVPGAGVVHAGYSRQFTATAFDASQQPLPGRTIIWTSSNQGIASVEATTGIVGGVSQGSVQIIATSEGVQAVADVTIDLVRVTTVSVAPPTATLLPTQTQQLIASPQDSAGNFIQGLALGGRPTVWTTTNAAAATVSTGGLVTAVAPGLASAEATIGGTTGGSAITVNALPSAAHLAIVTQPSATAQNDVAFPVQPTVQLKDALNNDVLTAGVIIQAAITAPGTGALGGTVTATTNASGLATFSNLKITGTIGGRSLTFTAGALTPATSSLVNLQAGVPTQLVLVTPPPSSANSGQVFSSPSVLQLRDVSGNDVPQAGTLVSAAVSPSAGVTLSGASTTTSGTGAATFGALSLTGPAGSYTLTFSAGALPPVTSGAITLGAGSGSRLSITVQPSASAPNGQVFAQQPVIQLLDGSNNPVAQAGIQVSAAILSGGGALGGTTVATTNAAGQATFTNLSITGTVGSRTLLFGASGFTAVTSSAIDITPGAPSALSIVVQPSSSAQSGAPFGAQPQLQLLDVSGNVVPQAGVTVTASLNGAGGSLIGSNTAATSGAGLATFSGLGISGLVGSYSLSFSAGGGISGVTSSAISLTAGAAAQLTITTQPGSAASGAAFTQQPAVQVRDAQGNVVNQAGLTITASIASGGPGSLFSASATTNGSGLAVFSGLGITGTVGSYTLAFASAPLSGATSAAFTLAHGAAAQLAIVTQPAGAASGAAFTTQPAVQVRDAQGNPVTQAGLNVSASISSGPGGATLVGSGSAATTASGTATFAGLGISGTVGSYTLDFGSSGVPSVTSAAIALGAGAASQLTITTPPSSSVQSGSTLAQQPAVQLRDAGGNAVAQAGVIVTAVISPAGASLTGGVTAATDGAGLATFSNLGITGLAGTYAITFSSGSLTPAVSGSISVTPAPATQLSITTPPGGAASGAAFTSQPVIQLRDAGGNPVSQGGVLVTASPSGGSLVGSGSATTNVSGQAVFSGLGLIGTVGSYTITFSSTGLTQVTSGAFTLGPGAPAQLVIQTQPGGAASGAAFTTQPAILVQDAQGNAVGAGITVSASIASGTGSLVGSGSAATAVNGVATFSGLGLSGLVGNYTLNFSASGATTVTSGTIALAAGAATQITMSAQPPASSVNGTALSSAPAVQLRDAAGNPVTTSGTTVNVALVGAGALGGALSAVTSSGAASFPGLVITGTVGSYSLAFSSGGLTGTTSSAISLTAGAPTQLSMATQPPASSVSGSALSPSPAVQLRDVSGNVAPVSGVDIGVSLNGAGGSLSGSTTATTDGSGVATFAGLGITGTAGSYSLTFTSGSLTGVTSSAINLTLPATQLGVTAQPSPNATNGSPFAAQPAVQLLDVNGSPVNQSGVTVSAATTGGTGTLNGTTQAVTANGVATFTDLGITGTVGTYSLTFSASGLSSAQSNPITLVAGAATQLTITTQPPSSVTAGGVVFAPQPVIQLRDAQGNAVSSANVTVGVAIASGPAGATLFGGISATTDGSGVAAFSGLGINGPQGNYTLTFTAAGLNPVTSSSIAILSFGESDRSLPANLAWITNVESLSTPNFSLTAPEISSSLRLVTRRGFGHDGSNLGGTKSVSLHTSAVAIFSGSTVDEPDQFANDAAGEFTVLVLNSFVKSP